jgi:hypothetical protein
MIPATPALPAEGIFIKEKREQAIVPIAKTQNMSKPKR